MDLFEFSGKFSNNLDIFGWKFYGSLQIRTFINLEETNQVQAFLTQVIACTSTNYLMTYSFTGYENLIVEVLRNTSESLKFDQQKASWNSQFDVAWFWLFVQYFGLWWDFECWWVKNWGLKFNRMKRNPVVQRFKFAEWKMIHFHAITKSNSFIESTTYAKFSKTVEVKQSRRVQ